MQFRPACTAVSVAGVTIFTTFPLQPTKCNFLRYVYGHDDGGSRGERGGEGGVGERKRDGSEPMNVESIVVGVEASRWEGYNERLAISSINIFRRFATEGVLVGRWFSLRDRRARESILNPAVDLRITKRRACTKSI